MKAGLCNIFIQHTSAYAQLPEYFSYQLNVGSLEDSVGMH